MFGLKTCVFVLFLLAFQVSSWAETPVTPTRDKLNLTLYQNNLGLIEDHRIISMSAHPQRLQIEGVSPQMIPDSLILYGDQLNVQARHFNFDVTTAQKLLDQSVGKTVRFRKSNPATGQDEIIEAKILSTQGQGIIERDGQIETGFPGNLILDRLPDDFLSRPSLSLDLSSVRLNTKTPLALGYLSTGMSWDVTYVLDLSRDATQALLRPWASLKNTTGMDFPQAQVFLSAGKINQQRRAKTALMSAQAPAMARMALDAAPENVGAAPPEAQSNLYVYPIVQKVDLKSGQNLQVALSAPLQLTSKRTLVQRFGPIYGDQRHSAPRPLFPTVELSFKNSSELPLPGGLVRVYSPGSMGQQVFLGEDRMGQTPRDQDVILRTGQSFDVSLKRTQTSYQISGLPKNTYRASYEIVMTNAGDTPEVLRLEERFGGDWSLRSASVKPETDQPRLAVWRFELAGGESQTLNFEVEVRNR